MFIEREPTEEEKREERMGQYWAKILLVPKKRSTGRYNTAWGDKTGLGFYRIIKRMVEED